MTDPTDKVIDPEDWEPHQVICGKPLWELKEMPNICLCDSCKKERDKKCEKDIVNVDVEKEHR